MITFESFDKNNYDDCLIVTDSKLAELYGLVGDNVFVLPRGERAKNFYFLQKLCKWFLQKDLQKDGKIVAVGGGSVGDVTAFAAGIFKRGVKLLHVPTTLLAQIDSSIGGKTAVDLDGIKNAVGIFNFDSDTLIDVKFLETLPKKQMNNGYGELLKYRMLSEDIDKIAESGCLSDIVRRCAEYKSRVCEQDPCDKNLRKQLNFGHTIGHAMELCCKLSHGEAVANGLYYETLLATKLDLCSESYLQKWKKEICAHFDLHKLTSEILQHTKNDKKNADDKIGVILPCGNGRFEFRLLQRETLKILTDD